MDKLIRIKGIDIEIQIIFKSTHINKLLEHLVKAGLPTSVINQSIDLYIATGEKVPYEKWFLYHGQTVLNPIINRNLNRESNHPTFNNMLKHVLKDELTNHPILKSFKRF